MTKHIREVLYSPGDEKTREDLSAIEASYFDACKEYLEAEVPSVEAWAAYKSRISAVGLLVDANYRAPEKKYLGDGDGEIPQTLRLLEKNAFIQIIMGRMPVSSFDSFVEWSINNGFYIGCNLEIDRKENDKGYSPENCQYITKSENLLKMPCVNMTKEDVFFIRSEEFDISKIKEYGYKRNIVKNILSGRTFKDLV